MADIQTEDKIFTVLLGIIEVLCQSATQMETLIEKPEFIDAETPDKRFRFTNPDLLVFQVLKCVRIASGLRASAILLEQSHTTEVGVLFRTIDDFISDVTSADEIIDGGIGSSTQREFLEQYFIDDKRSIEEMLENPNKIRRPRQKIQASEARIFGGDNPDRVKKISRTVDDVSSGVVHGNYSSVMEMYGGSTLEDAHFHTRGVAARFSGYRYHFGLYVHRALNTFFKVAYNLGHHELARHLRELRREFEKSPAYTRE